MSNIDRWREDMLDDISRQYRRASLARDTQELADTFRMSMILMEDIVQEVSRLRVLLRENGIDD